MIYLDLADLLHVAERTLGGLPEVRDAGLLESAVARPQTTVFGADAYGSVLDKAAALAQSIALNHALVDGNKRLTLAAVLAFLGLNGRRLTMSNDEAYDFVIAIVTRELPEVTDIATTLEEYSQDWP